MFLIREATKDASAPLSTDTRCPEGLFWQAICVGKGETQGQPEISLGGVQSRGSGKEVYMQKIWVFSLAPKKFWRMEPTPSGLKCTFP